MGQKRNTALKRVDPSFDTWGKDIILERIKRGKDKEPVKFARLTKGITRVPELKEFLVNSDFKKEGRK